MYKLDGREIRGFIFDMDGTLFDSERMYYDIWGMAERKFHFTGRDDLFRLFTGAPGGQTFRILYDYFGDADLARRMEEFHDREALRLAPEYGARLQPGAREILEHLWERGFPTAMATSSNPPRVERQFREAGIPLQFDAVVTGDMVERGKPAPDIFLLAAEQLGIPIPCCAVVEDSHNGIRAAASSGAFSILVPDIVQPDRELRELAHRVCPSLEALLEQLRAQEAR